MSYFTIMQPRLRPGMLCPLFKHILSSLLMTMRIFSRISPCRHQTRYRKTKLILNPLPLFRQDHLPGALEVLEHGYLACDHPGQVLRLMARHPVDHP